ncbi:hypothetical protein CWE14_04765 [Aliidiomarina soli]|uniref:Uncharacterized protein n=2 Tax=Aliidiomarina soli TaxID=1928574 RepID=A0A432WJ83_9GAMM|nr:hypothetical protein CWE14_04765 [Aliidiomarina soli]
MYFLTFIFFLIFIISAIASLMDRKVIRRKLKHAEFEKYYDYFPTESTQTSIVSTWKVLGLFVFGKWKDIESPELLHHLKRHRRIEVLAISSFFIAQFFFLLALALSEELNAF